MKLFELQRYFARAATSGSGPLPELERVFLGSEQLSARARLGIYNRGYFYRLLDALASVFGQTKRLLGDAAFERLGLSYLARHPSVHPAVERVGRAFPEFLREVGETSTLVDLASLEWARLCALVAPNPANVATPQAIDPSCFAQAQLRFVPSLHRLELDPRALSAFAGDAADLANALPAAPRCGVAIWRSEHAVLHRALDATEWGALASAIGGATLSQVCAVIDSGSEAEDVRQAFEMLRSWFARRWLASLPVAGP